MMRGNNVVRPLWKAVLSGLVVWMSTGCGGGDSERALQQEPSGRQQRLSFEEFLSKHVHKQSGEHGVYVYDGDMTATSLEELRQAYARMFPAQGLGSAEQGLAVNVFNGYMRFWSPSYKRNLRYCISNNFGSGKALVVDALNGATQAWEQYVDVDFIYAPDQDANCTASNTNVIFDVQLVSQEGTLLMSSFFPHQERPYRTIKIYPNLFLSDFSLQGAMSHALGHGLGFRHESTRPEATPEHPDAQCYENDSWYGVTPYDAASVMNAPDCGGTNVFSTLTTSDIEGSTFYYGSKTIGAPMHPGGCGVIPAGTGLAPGQNIQSCDGRFMLALQTDGNLVLYQGSTALWSTGTSGQPSYGLYMQGDGNLVLYSGLPRALWNAGVISSGATLYVQTDGNVVIYSASGVPLWSTGTGGR